MTRAECDTVIEWCRKKIREKNYGENYTERLSGNRLEGYEMAMKAVMSYFHYIKEDNDNGEN